MMLPGKWLLIIFNEYGDFSMKKILAGILLSMLISSTALAETVIVTGSGATRDVAINDAKRNAVEKVVGSYISSTTIVRSPYVLKDEIYSKAYGFVKDIQILQESSGAAYEVQARVDVDSSPNSQLMNKLETIKMLNDPRISVVVMHNTSDKKSLKYTNLCEAIITEKLRELGFRRIVDKAKVWQKKNEGRGETVISKDGGVQIGKKPSQTVTNDKPVSVTPNITPVKPQTVTTVVEKKPPIAKPGQIDYEVYLPNSDTDYFIFGSLEFSTSKVMHPAYSALREEKAADFDTGFMKTTATLEIKILKSDTIEQVGIYSVTANSLHSDTNVAEREAVEAVATKAAEKIAETFTKKGASIENGFELKARVEHENLDKLLADVKKAVGIRNVRLRNYENGKAYYEVEGDIKTFELFKYLQQESRFKITKLNLSDNLLEIIVV